MKIVFILSIILIIITNEKDILRWTFEITNHGARTPHKGLDSKNRDFTNHKWIANNELTGVGLRQSFLVGYRDRLRYIYEKKLIEEEYDPRDILIYSTENNRTLMSATSLLHGLFLPGTGPQIDPNLVDRAVPPVESSSYQEEKEKLDKDNCTALPGRMNLVPVHISFSHEYFIQFENSKKCIGLESFEKKNRNRIEVKNFLNQMTQKYGNNLSKIITTKNADLLEDYEFAYQIFDTIVSLYLDGAKEFDELVKVLNVSEEELLNDCYKFLNMNIFGNGIDNDRDIVNYLISPVFYKIIQYMDYKIEKDSKGEMNYKGYDLPKYFIVSGTANSLGVFMSFMNKYYGTEKKDINYATNLHLELYLEDKGSEMINENNYRLEFYYNDEFLLSIRYVDFKNKIKDELINQNEINRFCKEKEEEKIPSDEEESNWYIIAIVVTVIILIGIIISIIVIIKKRKKKSDIVVDSDKKNDKLIRNSIDSDESQ